MGRAALRPWGRRPKGPVVRTFLDVLEAEASKRHGNSSGTRLPRKPVGVTDAAGHQRGGERNGGDREKLGVNDRRHTAREPLAHGGDRALAVKLDATLDDLGRREEGRRTHHRDEDHLEPEDGLVGVKFPSLSVDGDAEIARDKHEQACDSVDGVSDGNALLLLLGHLRLDGEALSHKRTHGEDECQVVAVLTSVSFHARDRHVNSIRRGS